MLSDLCLGAGRDLQGLVSGEVARHQNVDDSRAVRYPLQRTADCAVFFAHARPQFWALLSVCRTIVVTSCLVHHIFLPEGT